MSDQVLWFLLNFAIAFASSVFASLFCLRWRRPPQQAPTKRSVHPYRTPAREVERPIITHVAVRFRGRTYSLPRPNRHHNVIKEIVDTTGATYVDSKGEDQGFLDSDGLYLTRQEAFMVAQASGQLRQSRLGAWSNSIYLFSEDLW